MKTYSSPKPGEQRGAIFSDCRCYRYTLRIVWDADAPLCQFIGLNPSTADEIKDDATIRRCKNFARAWGMGGIVMTNLFAWRATHPRSLFDYNGDPVGESIPPGSVTEICAFQNLNDYFLVTVAEECERTIACWGIHGKYRNRAAAVAAAIKPMKCFGLTRAGFPKHPVRLAKSTPLFDFSAAPLPSAPLR